MRCNCCGVPLLGDEIMRKLPDGSIDDMCNRCIREALYPEFEPEKQLESITNPSSVYARKGFARYYE